MPIQGSGSATFASQAIRAPAPAAYTTAAVHFDGVTNLINSALVSSSSGYFGCSFWVKAAASNALGAFWAVEPEPGWGDDPWKMTSETHGGGFRPFAYFNDPDYDGGIECYGGIQTWDAWTHVLVACQGNIESPGKIIKVYVNNVDQTTDVEQSFYTAPFNFALNGMILRIFNAGGGSYLGTGDLADFWLSAGANLLTAGDIAPATRAKFINPSTLKPVSLGSDGSTPTGTAPDVFLRRAPAAAASTFLTNQGPGGNFSQVGGVDHNATTVSASPVIVVDDLSSVVVGQAVAGTDIPADTFVLSINIGALAVTLTNNAAATHAVAIPITFGGKLTNAATSPSG